MFSKLALFVASALAVSAVAVPPPSNSITNSCNTGPIQCCNSIQDANSQAAQAAIGNIVGGVAVPIVGQVGLTCSPISAIGIGSNSCSAQPACCTGNNYNGIVVVGCSPVKVL